MRWIIKLGEMMGVARLQRVDGRHNIERYSLLLKLLFKRNLYWPQYSDALYKSCHFSF